MIMKKHLYFWVFFILLSLPVDAQKNRYPFKHLTVVDGLSQSNVTSILQDSQGFMWFGTQDGLNKYDGYKFTIYQNNTGNPNSLSNNYVMAVLEDRNNNLWVATQGGGLNRYDREKDIFIHYKHDPKKQNSIANDKVLTLYEDKAGYIWIGTEGGGLDRFDTKTQSFTNYRTDYKDPNKVSDNNISAFLEDSHGNFWVGTFYHGLNLMDRETGTFKHFGTDGGPQGLNGVKITQIYEDFRGDILVGVDRGGMSRYNVKTKTFTHYLSLENEPGNPNALVNSDVICLREDKNKNLWIGTRNGGIDIMAPNGNVTRVARDNNNSKSLNNNSIYAIYRDKNDNMWVGTFAGGVNLHYSQKENFKHYKVEQNNPTSLSNNEILSFLEDHEGNIWVGTDGGGLNKMNPVTRTFKHFKYNGKSTSVTDDVIMSMAQDGSHSIWISTLNTGLNVLHKNSDKFINYRYDSLELGGVHWNAATCMLTDYEGNIWIGTWGQGVSFYDKKTHTTHHIRKKTDSEEAHKTLSSNIVFSLYEDRNHNILIGTQANGFSILNRKTGAFEHFAHVEGDKSTLSGNTVNAFLEDKSGNLWIGTNEGLNLFDRVNKTFSAIKIENGLPNNVIQAILEDNNGSLWLSTNKGIANFNPKTKAIRNFDVSDGLQGNEFKRNSALKTRKGELFFGGTNGLNSFFPDSIKDNPAVPPIVITNFQIFNKPVPIGIEDSPLTKHITQTKEITLPYHQSVFTFDYSALNFTLPEKNQYAYRLEGFDKEWNLVGNKRTATYTNLDPGKYLFRVKGSNNDGIWNEAGTSIILTITPPFWKTWWFRTIMVMSLIGGAITFYKVRMRAIKAQKEELEQKVKEQTADIQAQAEELQAQADLLLLTNEDLQKSQQEIAEQRDHLKIVNEQVMSSIKYAQTIQKAILPSQQKIAEIFPDHFILYRPKDVVSGDFYWFAHLAKEDTGLDRDLSFMAAVDCTGHGVPGAFMSIIGTTILNEIVNVKQTIDPAQILEDLDTGVKQAIEKAEGINTAGMDVCICRFERLSGNQVKVFFSGAKRDLLYIKPGEKTIHKLPSDRRSIGSKASVPFTTKELVLESSCMIYMTTDGYSDQNNPQREKLGSANFHKLLSEVATLMPEKQNQQLAKALDDHQQDSEQRDDITLIGIKI
jgi:ligand-binding sensor domain-containing protein/serine phosphatase RsbU (regulator of sigma subunit)